MICDDPCSAHTFLTPPAVPFNPYTTMLSWSISTLWWLYVNLPFLTLPIFLVGFWGLASLWIPAALQNFFFKPQNLREKYNARWALVTGGSSGIGAAIVRRCCEQGLSVVVVALDDKVLADSVAEFRTQFPKVEVRSIGADLSRPGYMDAVKEGTKDIDVQLVFNNAGYVRVGMFVADPIEVHLKHLNVNATNTLEFTHHFVRKMRERNLKGLVGFTSSAAALIPAPTSVLYPSTKMFVTQLAASLAGEYKEDGIDFCAVLPSPTRSRFYDGTKGQMGLMDVFEKLAGGPEVIADAFFANAGRFVIVDQGWLTVAVKTLLCGLDSNILAEIITYGVRVDADYKRMRSSLTKELQVEDKKSS
ncbi:hypothetical protein BJ742DRAFT_794640 [Cladochytrium replicatum]|nr:hypothetical protein BJ742DRAFT_794640 [Cladochytrium replicatum]